MNDQTTPAGITPEEAKKAREWALHALNKPGASTTAEKAVARVVIGTVPEPRPTLADMTLDEQDECTGMQADLAQGDRVVILDGTPDAAGLVQVLEKSLDVYRAYPKEVTPRPDLPPMTWPGDTPTGSDHLAVGTVIESADDPRLAALPVGSILLDCDGETAINRGEVWVGDGYIPIPAEGDELGPWTVLHIPKEADQ